MLNNFCQKLLDWMPATGQGKNDPKSNYRGYSEPNRNTDKRNFPHPCRPYLDIEERKIPLTPGVDPLDLLTNDGNNAKMTSEGLPADRISLENGSIITNCKRWPLIIDPQQQVGRPMDLLRTDR